MIATVSRVSELFPVLDLSKNIMEVFGEIKAKLFTQGEPVADLDLMIAATALYMNMPIVTNNRKHFSRIPDLVLVDWKLA